MAVPTCLLRNLASPVRDQGAVAQANAITCLVDPTFIASLAAEVRQMRHDLNLLIEKSPESISPWIPPRELARLLGVSSQTITAYRNDGRFRSSSTRAIKRGQRTDWEYHRQDAIADVRGLV